MGPSSQPQEDAGGRSLPTQLGRFTLLREIGAGGMATVYLGKMRLAEGLERLVAIKTIHDDLADQTAFVDMFLDEAKIATQISHPNVCTVHDFGQAGPTYYMAMEYLIGEPLSEVIRQVWEFRKDSAVMQALPFLAARIIADACEGLHAAHQTVGTGGQKLEVVHRDVSPQNLFVTYEGAVKVVDFGCAKALQRITETTAGIFKGKLAYAAPEQLKIQKLDARTDVWALGAVLWETLTLERVFKKDSPMKTARAILESPIRRVDEVDPYMPRELADIVARALTRAPEERYQSARDMGRALRRYIASAGTTFESAESADWMRYLFREQRHERLQLAAKAEATLAHQALDTNGLPSGPHSSPRADLRTPARSPVARPYVEEPQPELSDSLPGYEDDIRTNLHRSEPALAAARPAVAVSPVAVSPVAVSPVAVSPAAVQTPHEADVGDLPFEEIVLDDAPLIDLPEYTQDGRPSSRRLRLDAEDRVGGRRRERGSARWMLGLVAVLLVAASVAVGLLLFRGSSPFVEPASGDVASGAPSGTVIVRTDEGAGEAEVYRGEQLLGRTPLTVSLPVGEQRLTLRGFGRDLSEEVVVPVTEGATARITVRPR